MKQEFILEVPDYVMHISDWKELELPKGHYIMDKVVTGCGFTEYFLNNNIPTILCCLCLFPNNALRGLHNIVGILLFKKYSVNPQPVTILLRM